DADYKQFNEAYDPNAMVQTGPGLPKWRWSTTSVTFSGPVERSQRLHFYFLSPPINLLLALLRAALLLLLFARLLPFGTARLPGFGRPAAALATLLSILFLAPAVHADLRVQLTHAARRTRRRAAPARVGRSQRHYRRATARRSRAVAARARPSRR